MKIVLFANTEWYLFNFRRSLALALAAAGHDVLLISPPGPYGERLRNLGFRWEPAPMRRRSLNPFAEARLVFWLVRLLRREQIDVVHGFTIKCAVYGSLAGRMAGTSGRINAVAGMGYVFTSEALLARALRPVVRALLRLALDGNNARLILQNGDDVELFTQERLVPADRIRLIPGSGVDCRRFAPNTVGRPASAGAFRVLLAARLLWDKGIAEYVEAASLIRRERRNVQFLLAGEPDEGNPAAVPERFIKKAVEDGNVEWLGHVDDMATLITSVDLVVLPSYREGLPKGLIEAAACGIALVTTDVPGCREVVTHDVDGLLIPAKDAEALARAILRLQDDSDLRIRLGAAALQKARAEFDERMVIQKTVAVYDELIAPADGQGAGVLPGLVGQSSMVEGDTR